MIRSNKRVEKSAEEVFSELRRLTSKVHGVGYTRDEKGYVILIYHSGAWPRVVPKIERYDIYRVEYRRQGKPLPA